MGQPSGSVFLLNDTGMTKNLCSVRPPDNIVPTFEHKSILALAVKRILKRALK
jgi:hypothetical protein